MAIYKVSALYNPYSLATTHFGISSTQCLMKACRVTLGAGSGGDGDDDPTCSSI